MIVRRTALESFFIYFCAVILTIIVLAPPTWLFISSISTQSQLIELPFKWIPSHPSFYRYIAIATEQGSSAAAFFRYTVRNSLIVGLSVTLVCVSTGVLAAYSSSRLHFRGQDATLFIMLFSYMLPPIMILVPLYVIIRNLGLLDTRISLVIVYSALLMPFAVWILKGFFDTIPSELEDAARIDGCTHLGALIRVVLPLSAPGIAAASLLTFIMSWEEFLIALVFTSGIQAKTITVGISEFTDRFQIDYPYMSTGGVVAFLIPVALCIIFQKGLIRGLTAGAVKG
jgi:multiple sugar transport system permease protein